MKLTTSRLILGVIVVCAAPSVALATAPHAGATRTTTLVARGSKGHLTLREGGVVKVEFRNVATDGGYRWVSSSAKPAVLRQTGQPTYTPVGTCKPGEVGCAESEFFSLRAVRKGSGKVTFELLPPGKGARRTNTYVLTATVS